MLGRFLPCKTVQLCRISPLRRSFLRQWKMRFVVSERLSDNQYAWLRCLSIFGWEHLRPLPYESLRLGSFLNQEKSRFYLKVQFQVQLGNTSLKCCSSCWNPQSFRTVIHNYGFLIRSELELPFQISPSARFKSSLNFDSISVVPAV